MEIFLDSANLEDIRRWLAYGVVDGVTTNPSILLKDGADDMKARAKEIAELIHPRPVSVEVYTNDHEEMIEQARAFRGTTVSQCGHFFLRMRITMNSTKIGRAHV